MKKVANLRTYFAKELGKTRSSVCSGMGQDEVYTSKWPHFQRLRFLDDQVTPRKGRSNLTVTRRPESENDLEVYSDRILVE